MKIKAIVLSLVFLSTPLSAFGSGCDCGTINTIVSNHASSTVQSVNANTDMQADMLKVEINTAATNIIGTLQTQTKTIVGAIQLLKETLLQTAKAQAVAQEASISEDTFGDNSQPESLCGSSSVSAGIQIGQQASNVLKEDLREKQVNHSNNPDAKSLDFLKRFFSGEHPSILEMIQSLFPTDKTLTADEVAHAHETLKTLGNPFPLPVATDEQKKTPAGEGYAAAKEVQEGRIGLAMDILNDHVSFHAPTLPVDVATWAKEQWTESGATGSAPGIVDDKISQAGLFNLLSQLRIGNPNWVAKLGSKNSIALQREQLFIDALNLEIQRKNNELLSSLVFITAMDYLVRIENNPEFNEVYNKLITHQQ